MKFLPISSIAAAEPIGLFRKELELCRVKKGEAVLVWCDSQTTPSYPGAFVAAATQLGAEAAQITIPSTSRAVQAFTPQEELVSEGFLVNVARSADLIIDLVPGIGKGYGAVWPAALRAGKRILTVRDPLDILERTLPSLQLKAKVIASQKVLDEGRELRMTSEAGTDIRFDKTQRRAIAMYGIADEPGHWDYWAGAQVATTAVEDSAEGLLVINVGDILLPLSRYVSAPIRCRIEGGRIESIEGDGLDAFLMREWFENYHDPNAYVIAHIGWGLQDNADWTRLSQKWVPFGGMQYCESRYGVVQIAFGLNVSGLLPGGRNNARAHFDIDCRNCSFYVDGELILEKGTIVPDGMR
jgi:2,5-dihydroxypyridine 5,6-dioxygenase